MQFRNLGKSSLKISEIGFGCMSLGTDQKQNEHLIHSAMESGINFLDTADLYQKGFNEESVGKAISGKRDDVILATKVGNVWNEDGNSWHWDASPKHIIEGIEASLKRLDTDHIDLYQLHGGMLEDPIDDIIDTFEKLVVQGKILNYGISSIRPNVIREFVKKSNIVSVMMQYSLLDRRPEESIEELLRDNSISILARGSLAQGMLAGKPAGSYLNYNQQEVETLLESYDKHLPRSSFSLQYVLSNPVVASAVVGIRTETQLNQIIEYKNGIVDQVVLEKTRDILEPLKYHLHR